MRVFCTDFGRENPSPQMRKFEWLDFSDMHHNIHSWSWGEEWLDLPKPQCFHFRFWEEEKFNGDLPPGGDLLTPPKRDYNENPVLIMLLLCYYFYNNHHKIYVFIVLIVDWKLYEHLLNIPWFVNDLLSLYFYLLENALRIRLHKSSKCDSLRPLNESKRLLYKSGPGNCQKGAISGAGNRRNSSIKGPWMSQKGYNINQAQEIAKKVQFPVPEIVNKLERYFMRSVDSTSVHRLVQRME